MRDIRIKVVTPPQPFVTPSEIRGEGDPEFKAGAIAAATRMISAPSGWLGRSLGEQTLEVTSSRWPYRLPYGPVLDVEAVRYRNTEGVEQTLPKAAYKLAGDSLLPTDGHHWPAHNGCEGSIRITYRAGYQDVPAEARMAVRLAAQGLIEAAKEDGGLRSFSVEGAFSRTFNSPDAVERTRTKAVEMLLGGLRIFRH